MLPNILDQLPLCRGLFVGGCVARGVGSSFRAAAHTHNDPSDPWYGWICFRAAKRIMDYFRPVPSPLLWHEYAHLMAPGEGHGPRWKTACATLTAQGVQVHTHYKGKRRG